MARSAPLFLGLGAAALLSSCQSCSETGLAKVHPKIAVSPDAIDLGDTPIGVIKKHTIEISSIGAVALNVSSIMLIPPAAGSLSNDLSVEVADPLPKSLPNGTKMSFDVQHVPLSADLAMGVVRISSNDPDRPTVDVPIVQHGLGAPRAVAVADFDRADIEAGTAGGIRTTVELIEFRNVPLGSRSSEQIFVVNGGDGNIPLKVESIAIVDPSSSPGLTISAAPDPARAPILLPLLGPKSRSAPAANRKIQVGVTWMPTQRDPTVSAILRISTSDPARPNLDIPITSTGPGMDPPRLRLDPADGLDFGNVMVGSTAELAFTAHNDGQSPLRLDPLTLTAATPPEFTLSDAPAAIVIMPQQSRSFSVKFRPTAAHSHQGAIHIVSNDPAQTALDYPLNGRGTDLPPDPPRLRLEPPAGLDFGIVPLNQSAQRFFTAYNDGGSPLTIQPLSLLAGSAPELTLTESPQPVMIGPQGSHRYGVAFRPTAAQPYRGTIRIVSNDPARSMVDYPLNGSGMTMPVCMPTMPDPHAPGDRTCAGGFDRGTVVLMNNQPTRVSWNDSMLYPAMDEDWSRLTVHVNTFDVDYCTFVGYDITAAAALPGGEQAEVCIKIGSCTSTQDGACGMGTAHTLISPFGRGDALCQQYMNNIPVFVQVRHSGGDLTCRPYTLNFSAR